MTKWPRCEKSAPKTESESGKRPKTRASTDPDFPRGRLETATDRNKSVLKSVFPSTRSVSLYRTTINLSIHPECDVSETRRIVTSSSLPLCSGSEGNNLPSRESEDTSSLPGTPAFLNRTAPIYYPIHSIRVRGTGSLWTPEEHILTISEQILGIVGSKCILKLSHEQIRLAL